MFDVGATTAKWAEKKSLAVHYLPQVPSTNSWAKDSETGKIDAIHSVYLTSHQTSGRGRGNRAWEDTTSGGALLSSWVANLSSVPNHLTSARVGLALITALRSVFPKLSFSLKAPNDIYLGSQKLAGILIENLQQGSLSTLIVGIGINVWSAPLLTGKVQARSLIQALESLDLSTWEKFLETLLLQLQDVIRCLCLPAKAQLSLSERTSLLYNLNLNPLLPEPYEEVSETADLRSKSRLIPWSEL